MRGEAWPSGSGARTRSPPAPTGTGCWWIGSGPAGRGARSWYGHDPARFAELARRYALELRAGPGAAALADLVGRAARGAVTLVFAARDGEHSNAAVLRDLIDDALRAHA